VGPLRGGEDEGAGREGKTCAEDVLWGDLIDLRIRMEFGGLVGIEEGKGGGGMELGRTGETRGKKLVGEGLGVDTDRGGNAE
jgi:hypothetical protein